jgi:hypothetical protein
MQGFTRKPAGRSVRKAMSTEIIKLAGFKQTYWSGHHRRDFAEPALGFPSTQSPNAAINLLGGATAGKLILCTVPETARGANERNKFAGLMYAVVELWAVNRATKDILKGYPAEREIVDRWIDQWPRCLPIRRWYDLRNPRPFAQIHPDASKEARIARGRLRTPAWPTEAAALTSDDLIERDVYLTPALEEIHSMLKTGDRK